MELNNNKKAEGAGVMKSVQYSKLTAIAVIAIYNKEFTKQFLAMRDKVNFLAFEPAPFKDIFKECLGIEGKYLLANEFIQKELTEKNVDILQDHLFDVLYPILKSTSVELIKITVKTIIKSIQSLIVNGQVANFADLIKIDYQLLLIENFSSRNANSLNKLLQAMLMAEEAEQLERHLAEQAECHDGRHMQHANLSKAKFSVDIWKRVSGENKHLTLEERQIEKEFEQTRIKI